MDSFVFYESFHKVTESFDDHKFARVMRALYRKGLYGTEPDLEDETENSLVNMMAVNIKAAHDRYDKAKADGAKGGRPSKQNFIPPEEWKAYLKDHSQDETAEHFGISTRTLRNWIKAEAEKTGKNLTDTVTDTVTVTDTDTDTVTSIYKNINSRSRRGASEAPSLPALKEGERWVTDPYKMADGRIAADFMLDTGEERTMIISEP